MLLEELANRIRLQRTKLGLKQRDVANALQISPQAVSKWERGENAPDIGVFPGLARVPGVTVDWLLGVHEEKRELFEGTVLVVSASRAYEKSLGIRPREFASWSNGIFFQLTETSLHYGGIPVKYMGDKYLCFFSGANHRERAVRTVFSAKTTISDALNAGLNSGEIYLGSVGHPDYARPDIVGEAVNIAFATLWWAGSNAKSGIAATRSVIDGLKTPIQIEREEEKSFCDIYYPVQLYELTENKGQC
ncbi:helix-turn-helix domain-containing protein [Candidatus Hydrogenedentota bacterium]